MSTLSAKAVLECVTLTRKAEELAQRNRNTEASTILAQVATIKQVGLSTEEMRTMYAGALSDELNPKSKAQAKEAEFHKKYTRAFRRYLTNGDERELRELIIGGSAPTSQAYSEGASGGFFVPASFFDTSDLDAIAQTDPIVRSEVSTVLDEPSFAMRYKNVSGFDLSTIQAVSVAESNLNKDNPNLQSVAPVGNVNIAAYNMYRLDLPVSLEASWGDLDADDWGGISGGGNSDISSIDRRISQAVQVGLARKMGIDVMQTLANAVASSYSTQNSGYVTIGDLEAIAFNVNRAYRAAPKAGWLMNDSVWKRLNISGSGQSSSSSGVPYLTPMWSPASERLLGFPVYISPSCAGNLGGSPPSSSSVFFGDLSHIVVRKTQVWAKRTLQSGDNPGSISYGQATLRFRQRAGAAVVDYSNGTNPPITCATVTL